MLPYAVGGNRATINVATGGVLGDVLTPINIKGRGLRGDDTDSVHDGRVDDSTINVNDTFVGGANSSRGSGNVVEGLAMDGGLEQDDDIDGNATETDEEGDVEDRGGETEVSCLHELFR